MADMTKSFEDLDQKDSVVILILNIDSVLIIGNDVEKSSIEKKWLAEHF